jgi:hypothetical protein
MIPSLSDLPGKPRRIVLHWTGGGPHPSQESRHSYHYEVDQEGRIYDHVPVAQNMRRIVSGSPHAAHVWMYNSWSVGVALSGMHRAKPGGPYGPWPIREDQTMAMCSFVGRLCTEWGLPVDVDHVMTHWEVNAVHGQSRSGPWDITALPWDESIPPEEVGGWLRVRILESMEIRPLRVRPELREIPAPEPESVHHPEALRSPISALDYRDALRDAGHDDRTIARVAGALAPYYERLADRLPHIRQIRRIRDVWRALNEERPR